MATSDGARTAARKRGLRPLPGSGPELVRQPHLYPGRLAVLLHLLGFEYRGPRRHQPLAFLAREGLVTALAVVAAHLFAVAHLCERVPARRQSRVRALRRSHHVGGRAVYLVSEH